MGGRLSHSVHLFSCVERALPAAWRTSAHKWAIVLLIRGSTFASTRLQMKEQIAKSRFSEDPSPQHGASYIIESEPTFHRHSPRTCFASLIQNVSMDHFST